LFGTPVLAEDTWFAQWATQPDVRAVAGHFVRRTPENRNISDVALIGGLGWTSTPVAVSGGDGSFEVRVFPNPAFASGTQDTAAQVVASDVDCDGLDDIVALGATWHTTIPVAISNGDGSFRYADYHGDYLENGLDMMPYWAWYYPANRKLAVDVRGRPRARAPTSPRLLNAKLYAFLRISDDRQKKSG